MNIDHASENPVDGQCLAFALDKSNPGVLTMDDLNNQIRVVHEQCPHLTIEQCGVPNATWHVKCITLALAQKSEVDPSFKYKWSRVKGLKQRQLLDLVTTRGNGKLIVIGILNRSLYPDCDQNGSWAHAVCVDTETNLLWNNECGPDSSKPADEWLTPTKDCRGYFTKIMRVYRLDVL